MDTFGLWWFTKDYIDKLGERISLNNTNLILDGEELPFKLYRRFWEQNGPSSNFSGSLYQDSDKLGGDLICFKEKLMEFFAKLAECNIKPIIVFGGPKTNSKRYNRKAPKRDIARQHKQGNRMNSCHLLEVIFNEVVETLGLKTKQLNERKYASMFQLANELDCPILTSITDFLLYPLKKGFIMLDNKQPFDFFPYQKIVDKSIECHLISQKKLIQYLPGLQVSSVPLVKVLIEMHCDSDGPIKKAIYWFSSRNRDSKFSQNKYPMNRIIPGYLDSIRGRSYPDFIEEFCNLVDRYRGHNEYHEELKTRMLDVMENDYLNYNPGRDYKTVLAEYYGQDAEEEVVNYLYNLFDQFKLDCVVYNLILKKVHYTRAYLDDVANQSTQCLKLRPYSVALCLLRPLPYDKLSSLEKIKEQLDKDTFVFFDSLSSSLRRVEPLRQLDGFGTLDHLSVNSLMSLSEDEKRKLLLATFRSNSHELDAMETKLSKFIGGNSDQSNEIRLLLMLVKYCDEELEIADEFRRVSPIGRSFKLALTLNCLFQIEPSMEIYMIRRKVRAILDDINVPADDKQYEVLVYQIYSLQSSIQVFCMLNTLLGQIFPQPKVGRWFDGPVILKLTKAIETGLSDHCLPPEPMMEAINNLV